MNRLIEAVAKDWRQTSVATTEVPSSSSLPVGWRSRSCGRHLFVASPEGGQFNNRRNALVEMARLGLPESDLELEKER